MTEPKLKPLIFVVLDAPASFLGLKATDKTVLTTLVSYLNPRRNGTEVWPSNETLGAQIGCKRDAIRRSKMRLQSLDLIKIRADQGKSDLISINVDLIRRLADPAKRASESYPHPTQNATGQEPDPTQNATGTLRNLQRDPTQFATRTAYEQPKGTSHPSNFGCSTNPKVGDGDQQRKMPLPAVIATAADSMRSPAKEQPTEEKSDWQGERARARAAAGGKDPPG